MPVTHPRRRAYARGGDADDGHETTLNKKKLNGTARSGQPISQALRCIF